MINRDHRLPLYHRLRDEMLEKITTREWQPDTAIPTEAELTKTYSVAIGTVRRAVETLVAEGLLEKIQGRGTFVRRPDFSTSLFRFFRYQSADAAHVVPQGRILERALVTAPAAIATALALPRRAQAIHLKRLRLVNGLAVLCEEIWLPHAPFAPLMQIALADFGDLLYPMYEQVCGQTIASAQETLTVEAAHAELAAALNMPVAAPAGVIDRLAFGYDRQPLEWRRSRGAAADFRYQIEIR